MVIKISEVIFFAKISNFLIWIQNFSYNINGSHIFKVFSAAKKSSFPNLPAIVIISHWRTGLNFSYLLQDYRRYRDYRLENIANNFFSQF